jgi:ABC-type nitrate/sulfonate/bicarbonate transport system permease component
MQLLFGFLNGIVLILILAVLINILKSLRKLVNEITNYTKRIPSTGIPKPSSINRM